jgi:hypothetical protein
MEEWWRRMWGSGVHDQLLLLSGGEAVVEDMNVVWALSE